MQDAIVLSSQRDERVRAGLPGADVLIFCNSRKVQMNVQIRYKYMYYRRARLASGPTASSGQYLEHATGSQAGRWLYVWVQTLR